jgi:hypothetical protein
MTVSRDPYLAGSPLPPEAPHDPYAESVLDQNERGKDDLRGDAVDTLLTEPARPLTDDEKDAAEHDPGRAPRTFAPASERVPVEPIPGHDTLIEEGLNRPISPEAAMHPGDRSDPREFEGGPSDLRELEGGSSDLRDFDGDRDDLTTRR